MVWLGGAYGCGKEHQGTRGQAVVMRRSLAKIVLIVRQHHGSSAVLAACQANLMFAIDPSEDRCAERSQWGREEVSHQA